MFVAMALKMSMQTPWKIPFFFLLLVLLEFFDVLLRIIWIGGVLLLF